jgi:hypothetical protein
MKTVSITEFREKYEIDRTQKRGLKAVEKLPIKTSKHKYGANKTVLDGIVFDSAKESKRYTQLLTLEKHGVITNLVSNAVLKKENLTRGKNEKQPILSYKLTKRNGNICEYQPDFEYIENGQKTVEDVKGYKTSVYLAKKKLMLKNHGIEIKET